MGTIGEAARFIKPADCTCDYPRVVARNMNGHATSCPVYQRWLAGRVLRDIPPPEPPAIVLRREEVPDDESSPASDRDPGDEQPDDSCLGRMPRKTTGDPRREHETDPRGRHVRDPRQRRPQ